MLNYIYCIIYIIYSVINSILTPFQTIILLLWVVVLFKESNRLRKKAKYSTLSSYNQDASLQALNSKVEYRKSLFLFAIVLSELVSSILSFIMSMALLIMSTYYYTTEYETQGEFVPDTVHNFSLNSSPPTDIHCNITEVTGYLAAYTSDISRVLFASFTIPLIITFSLVYTLMSYYVMVTKKSLNYNPSLESVNLSRGQTRLLLTSFASCILLSLLVLRIEVYLLFHIIRSIIAMVQSMFTVKYSLRLVGAIKWKMLDSKIAHGAEHYLYKYYSNSLKKFKTFASIYIVIVILFCFYSITRTLSTILLFLYPYQLFEVYGICIPSLQSPLYFQILGYLVYITNMFEKVPMFCFQLSLFALNLLSIPYLLSKLNATCRFNCCTSFRFGHNNNLREPLF